MNIPELTVSKLFDRLNGHHLIVFSKNIRVCDFLAGIKAGIFCPGYYVRLPYFSTINF